MPKFTCTECHHEWESMLPEDVCCWCGIAGRIDAKEEEKKEDDIPEIDIKNYGPSIFASLPVRYLKLLAIDLNKIKNARFDLLSVIQAGIYKKIEDNHNRRLTRQWDKSISTATPSCSG